MKKLEPLKKKMLSDPAVRKAYDELAPEYEIARELIKARSRAGLTQSDVAKLMGTTQSVIARMESGSALPSMNSLVRYAKVTGSRAVVKLVADRNN
ncbi:MAG: helix-turn-helix transcriptional regulator [Gammaproteobacteria bacterium]|nr:helix-turn-helix transcriptional regulator [Gammaproteobacteria bacterium]